VALAASPLAAGQGVLVVLNDQISGAREVSKTNTASVDTFRNGDFGFLGYMRDGVPHFYRASLRRHTVATEFDVAGCSALPQVDIAHGYAGMNGIAVQAFVAAGARAIIYAGVGDGTVAASGMEPALIEARRQGVIVVRASRVGSGLIARNTANRDDEFGYVVADTLSPQKARVLAMLALTITADPALIQGMFYTY
jgi:L-asparaginase